jgi:hypothetical protein
VSASIKERRLAVVERVPAVRSVPKLAGSALATAAAYLALLVCAAVPTGVGIAVAAAAIAACEMASVGRHHFLGWALRRAGLDGVARGLLRGAALVLFAARSTPTAITIGVVATVVGLAVVRAVHEGVAQLVDYLRTPPITARGLELRLPPIPGAPPGWLRRPDGWSALLELILAGALAWSVDGADGVAYAGMVIAFALGVAAAAVLAVHALRLRRLRVRELVSNAVVSRLAELQPEVVAYLGNGTEWRYQLEMWLRALEGIQRPVLLLVRDHEVLQQLAPTRLPVVCIPGGSTLMELELPGLRAALYVGNTANNIHLLRRPRVRTVFIGHGDSDKGASANPFSRVYNEIWVAGPAGRSRYLGAGVDIPRSAFVEVGRPQLVDLPRLPDAQPRLTVLYAPTFEGFGEDPFSTSLPHVGPDIIRALLARGDVRVMYRPHPRTGHRDPATRRAHLEIISMLRAAGAPAPEAISVGPPPATDADPRGDLLDHVVASNQPASPSTHEAAVARWTAGYWAANPGHRILTPPAPDLHACFTVADALIADISSVTSDFLAANRPYAVVNCTGTSDDEFRRRSPSAAGGFILGRDLDSLDGLLRAAAGGDDPTAAARDEARRHLLGPRAGDPAGPFREQVDRLCALPLPAADSDDEQPDDESAVTASRNPSA